MPTFMQFDTTNKHKDQCPRCNAGKLRDWNALNEEEREVVRRLPTSAEFPVEERANQHRWCAQCWYEETAGALLDA
ncbi:MAG: hypothetical protein H0U81_03235 [Pyrinomonadaceae bacterium]|nr:hypothetical protein [Pyrinomonadaceae bacterium]